VSIGRPKSQIPFIRGKRRSLLIRISMSECVRRGSGRGRLTWRTWC